MKFKGADKVLWKMYGVSIMWYALDSPTQDLQFYTNPSSLSNPVQKLHVLQVSLKTPKMREKWFSEFQYCWFYRDITRFSTILDWTEASFLWYLSILGVGMQRWRWSPVRPVYGSPYHLCHRYTGSPYQPVPPVRPLHHPIYIMFSVCLTVCLCRVKGQGLMVK